jgi:hypothetical protein
MDPSYALREDVMIRKECFGCLCCNTSTGDYSQYNDDAFEILSELHHHVTIDRLSDKLVEKDLSIDKGALYKFLENMITDRIVFA